MFRGGSGLRGDASLTTAVSVSLYYFENDLATRDVPVVSNDNGRTVMFLFVQR